MEQGVIRPAVRATRERMRGRDVPRDLRGPRVLPEARDRVPVEVTSRANLVTHARDKRGARARGFGMVRIELRVACIAHASNASRAKFREREARAHCAPARGSTTPANSTATLRASFSERKRRARVFSRTNRPRETN